MKVQLLCMCYNSQETIKETLKSWEPYVDRIFILINGSFNNDYSNLGPTLIAVNDIKNIKIHVEDFKGFSETRNRLIKLSKKANYYSIFIDDSFKLISQFPKRTELQKWSQVMQIKIKHNNNYYNSNRIFTEAKYIGLIHEVIDTDLRIDSGIVVEDLDNYKSHIIRRNERQLYQLNVLDTDNTPRGLYYKACALINLHKMGMVSKDVVLEALYKRLQTPSTNLHENETTARFIEILDI